MSEIVVNAGARTRRSLLAAAAGGAAALAATAIKPAGVSAIAAPMLTETNNAATAPTGVSNSAADALALYAHATGEGTGSEGMSVTGIGVLGQSTDASDPENNTENAGVVGIVGDGQSRSANIGLTGVYGYSEPSPVEDFVGAGVWGESPDFGVIGSGGIGTYGDGVIGLYGYTAEAGGIAVLAEGDDPTGVALRVEGRAEFTRSGRGTFPANAASRTVALAGCTSSTLILATLAANRSGRWIRAVAAGNGTFTVYLNTKVTSATPFNWIAFTHPTTHLG